MKRASILSNARLFADLLIVLCSARHGVKNEAKSLSGVVQGSDGASVREVAATVKNADTGKVISIKNNRCGQYRAPSLRKGVYNIEASAPGFSPVKAKNVVLSMAGERRIDLSLKMRQGNVTVINAGDTEERSRKRHIS